MWCGDNNKKVTCTPVVTFFTPHEFAGMNMKYMSGEVNCCEDIQREGEMRLFQVVNYISDRPALDTQIQSDMI